MFLGYNKNLEYKNQKILLEEFVKPGKQTERIFADILYLLKHIGVPKTEIDLKKINDFIKANIKKGSENTTRKYERTAKEIWISKRCENSTDYCLVFESIARQVRIPTIHLQMVNKNWKNTQKDNYIEKHDACECFIGGKWVYVDPTVDEINATYNPNSLSVFSKETCCDYQVFAKSTDIFETGIMGDLDNDKLIKKLFGKQQSLKNI